MISVRMLLLQILLGFLCGLTAYAQPPTSVTLETNSPVEVLTEQELKTQAAVIYEIVHGALQVIHRDFFLEDESRILPSQSLSDVFVEVEKQHGVEIHWLTGNADEVNVEHQPRNDFEKNAVQELRMGKASHTQLTPDHLHFAGRVRLASQCLKCHVKQRKSLEDRFSILSISLPRRPIASQSTEGE